VTASRTERIYGRVFRIAVSFNRRFTTEELVHELSVRYPVSWCYLVRKYAPGGKGSGHPYSAASRVAMMLFRLAYRGRIKRHGYVAASPSWGSARG
jgi:hypothetical protein